MFTILLGAFTLVLFIYLLLIRRSVIIPTRVNKNRYWFYPLLALFISLSGFASFTDLNGRLQTIFAALVVLSFLMDKKGLAESNIVVYSLDNRGVPYSSIEKIVLQVEDKQTIKMNYFRNGRRGPILSFDRSLEELSIFFTTHLEDGSKLEIIIKED
ncbi:hypothetical protein [Enterococcus sp. AZ109]|uniref:hypothetical protein n=1 Tax=Enterococcus sp. AZ109 TaxID=2774634 RepID=UPI003F6847EF